MGVLGEPRRRIRPYRSHNLLQIFPPQPARTDPGPLGLIRHPTWRAPEDDHTPEPGLARVANGEDAVQQAVRAHSHREAIPVSISFFDDFNLEVVSRFHWSPSLALWQLGTDRERETGRSGRQAIILTRADVSRVMYRKIAAMGVVACGESKSPLFARRPPV
jgi:hypothetical protein